MPRQKRNHESIAALLPVSPYLSGNALVCGDNLDVLREIPDECVDLIYADPPFNSNSNYNAVFGDKGRVEAQLRDVWRWTVETENAYRRMQPGRLLDAINGIRLIAGAESKMAAYAVFMGRRLEEMRRALKPAGSIYLHCDPTANWLLRVLLDAVFGESQFRNEIVWAYTGPGNAKRWFPRKHDTLLFYSKTGKNLFQRDAVRIPYVKLETGNTQGIFKGAATLSDSGKVPEDYWLEGRDGMTPVTRLHGERVGYPTQKPTALLERIIKASAPPNGLVMDPFCGCGTAADAAAKLGRGYLGIDISAVAVRVMEQRLASRGGAAMPAVYKMDWDDYEWEHFERRALAGRDDTEDGIPGWA